MRAKKTYLPGVEWLYMRIYTGHRTADQLLTRTLYPAWQRINKMNFSDTWFFIRYADPDFHLRFRIKLKNDIGAKELKNIIDHDLQEMNKHGLVWKVESGTYLPEIERYGTGSMADAEQLFCFDSIAFMRFSMQEITHEDSNMRWQYALASIDHLLNDFQFDLQERKDLLLQLSRSFGKEFGKDKQLARQLSSKYRTHRTRISDLLSKKAGFTDNLIYGPLNLRSNDSKESIGRIFQLYEEGKMEVSKNDLISSLIHMSMNRIFRNNNRLHEMVIYDLLFRHYKSALITSGILSERN